VLVREPRTRIAGVHSEIALASKLPEIRAIGSRGSILIVQFNDPVLMTDRNDDIAIQCGSKRIGVGPIIRNCITWLVEMRAASAPLQACFAQDRRAHDVEVVEFVPKPLHLEVGIENDCHIAYHVDVA
jgi:hypothetical protein